MKFFKKQTPKINTAEIHQYVKDIDRLVMLRDKSIQMHRLYQNDDTDYAAEAKRYTDDIEMAQLVLHRLQDGTIDGK